MDTSSAFGTSTIWKKRGAKLWLVSQGLRKVVFQTPARKPFRRSKRDTIIQGGSHFWVCGWNPEVRTFKSKVETGKYFSVVLFIKIHKVVLTLQSLGKMYSNYSRMEHFQMDAVFKWMSKVITWLPLLHLVIGLKESRQFFNQWEAKPKPKPNTPCTRDFSRASSELQVIARNCDWFIALPAPVVIGRSNCFGFGFSTVIWKLL